MLQVLLFVAFLCSFSDVGDVYAFGENKMSQLGLGTQSPYVPSPTMVRTYSVIYKLPPANEVWGKVMFLHVSVHGEVCLQREQGDLPTEVEGCLPKEGVGQTPTPGTRKVGGPTQGKGFRLWGEGWSAYRGGWADPPLEPETRAVRILLECFLVILKIFLTQKKRKCETCSKSPLVSFMLPFILISTWNYVVLSDSAQGTSYSSSRLWCRIQYDG